MLDQLEVIKSILRTPGEVFYGSISEDGIVSQDIADAEPDIKWLVAEVERLRAENERLIKEFKDLNRFVTECDADERMIQPFEIGDRIDLALKGGVGI